MKTCFLLVALSASAFAGALKVAIQPARHPVKDAKAVASVVTYPLRHPVKALRAVFVP